MFESRVIRRIFVPKMDEVRGKWRNLHNEEFHNVYSSPDVIRLIKSRRMRWTVHGSGEKSVQGFGEKILRKETTRKTEA
jgi:hypothetical protein